MIPNETISDFKKSPLKNTCTEIKSSKQEPRKFFDQKLFHILFTLVTSVCSVSVVPTCGQSTDYFHLTIQMGYLQSFSNRCSFENFSRSFKKENRFEHPLGKIKFGKALRKKDDTFIQNRNKIPVE